MAFPTDLSHFTAAEFNHPDLMDPSFLRWLDRVRHLAGVPFQITNDARLSGDNPMGSVTKSLHKRGRAVDLRSTDWTVAQKWKVLAAVVQLAPDAPGKVELEAVFSGTDKHWHLGVDDAAGAQHEFIESDE